MPNIQKKCDFLLTCTGLNTSLSQFSLVIRGEKEKSHLWKLAHSEGQLGQGLVPMFL